MMSGIKRLSLFLMRRYCFVFHLGAQINRILRFHVMQTDLCEALLVNIANLFFAGSWFSWGNAAQVIHINNGT